MAEGQHGNTAVNLLLRPVQTHSHVWSISMYHTYNYGALLMIICWKAYWIKWHTFISFLYQVFKKWGSVSSFQVSSSNMAGTPTQASAAAGPAGGGAGSGSGQGDLDLFSDSSSTTKTDDMAKKPLSKDSILSLYGTNSMSQQAPAGEDAWRWCEIVFVQ